MRPALLPRGVSPDVPHPPKRLGASGLQPCVPWIMFDSSEIGAGLGSSEVPLMGLPARIAFTCGD